MRRLFARLHAAFLARGDLGQATTEYALVLLGAALVALLLVAWATGGGGAGKIGRLFNRVLDAVTSRVPVDGAVAAVTAAPAPTAVSSRFAA